MKTFAGFLAHVMTNFEESYPYGLSKTEVTRLAFQAWCNREAMTYNAATNPLAVPIPQN